MWVDAKAVCYDLAGMWASRKNRRKSRWKRKFARMGIKI